MKWTRLLRVCSAAALSAMLLFSCAAAEESDCFIPLPQGKNIVLPINLSPGSIPLACESETSYVDSSITVQLKEYEVSGTRCIVAYVRIADASQLRTAPAYDFNRTQIASTESIANRMHAVTAINGDFYSYWRDIDGGYMIRQGVQYNNQVIVGRDLLLIDEHGDFTIIPKATKEKVMQAVQGKVIVNTLNFGPGLIVDGEPLDMWYESEFCQSTQRNQRAAICQMENGSLDYVLAVCEGSWMREDTGLSIYEWVQFLQSLGVQQAYNLDGGNSTALIFGGEKVNEKGNPHHRELSDIIYFASAAQP